MENNKREINIDLNNLIRKTYNKIALWNNEDGTNTQKADMLKLVSHEIVEEILTDAFSQLEGVKTGVKLIPEKPAKKEKDKKGLFDKFKKNKKKS